MADGRVSEGATADVVDRLRLGVPSQLQSARQWLLYRLETYPGEDKPRKVPYYVSGGKRHGIQNSPDDKSRFATFDQAIAALAHGGYDGLGLAMSESMNVVGVDLDKCIDDGNYSALAQEVLSAVDTFAEISPSGTGLHVFYIGQTPNAKTPGIELFCTTGFLTVTGRRINGADIAPLPPALRTRLLELVGTARGDGDSKAKRLESIRTTDPVIKRLTERDLVKRHRQDGGVDIVCPFATAHTTGGGGAGDTVYWPPHVGGFKRGHFHCLHSHCANRKDEQFLAAIGLSAVGAGPSVEDDWPEPVDFLRSPSARPLAAEDVVPEISDYAVLFARAAGFCPSATILPAVVVSAAMIDDGIRLRLPLASSWFESARLWGLCVGGPGSGKTPASRAMAAPLMQLHKALVAQWVARQKLKKDEDGLEDEDDDPAPALFTSDCTIEKLSEILRANPRGILVFNDEFESWLGSHDCYRSGAGSRDRGEWLSLYDGGPHQVDRIKRGSYFVENWGASILSATTPGALKKLAPKLPIDGLLQRFLPVIVGPRCAPDEVIMGFEVDREREAFEHRLERLYQLTPIVISLGGEAQEIFEAEIERLRVRVDAVAAYSESFGSHVAKHAAMVARIALVFHCLSAGSDDQIGARSMQAAVNFMRKVAKHAFAIYADMMQAAPAVTLARDVGRFVLAKHAGSLERRHLVQSVRAFRQAERPSQDHAMDYLRDCGWLEPAPGSYDKAHHTAWVVNPRVWARFARQADEERERRAILRAMIVEGVNARRDGKC